MAHYVITPITIANGPTLPSTTTHQTTPNRAHCIALNDTDLCGIFPGKLTNWNQAINPETGSPYVFNTSITVICLPVGDEDANKMLTRHPAAVCTQLRASHSSRRVCTGTATGRREVCDPFSLSATPSRGHPRAASFMLATITTYVRITSSLTTR
ncbi:hypothetical protein [Burkholderia sp. Bp9140]|uniref:hypothetical protein n=1 Tax=Burkholderia sp. Bp9140 TaxID=2184572 RepID=UPI000F55BA40|nr:hypothetical protein [Burkholderia sp. Bp9140]